MFKIKVLIIDSGVKKEHPAFKNEIIKGFGFKDGSPVEDFTDTYGHGTAIFNIIRNCKDVEIQNIKLYGIEGRISDTEIIRVLEYVYSNLDVNIINLSLGIGASDNLDEFYQICEKLKNKGVLLISAFDNTGSMSYPAAFDNVIGVTANNNCSRIDDIYFYDDTVINAGAYGRIQRLAWTSPDYIFIGGNSFACAYVTLHFAKQLQQDRDIIKEIFNDMGVRRKRNLENERAGQMKFRIKKAALFPFNKEMHSLVRYSDMLSFEIAGIYESKYSGRVGTSTNHLLNIDQKNNYNIVNIDQVQWDEFDTLILGHLDEFIQYSKQKDIKQNIIDLVLSHGKNVYSFDDISQFIPDDKRSQVFCPVVKEENLPPWRFGKLYRIKLPVLGVFGTSSKQGKYTLQLMLRKLFMEKGVHLGQIGTEPSALLFDMDYVYPMGYNSSVYIKEYDSVRYLNYLMNQLARKNSDLILVGSQSGTVPYDTGNLEMFNIHPFHFLMGTQPDTIILCINPYDEMDYIKKTIQFIEASTEGKVIALVIFPMQLSSSWLGFYGSKEQLNESEEKTLKVALLKEFNLPIFILGTRDIDSLADYVISYYS